jgi:hypothetical protein
VPAARLLAALSLHDSLQEGIASSRVIPSAIATLSLHENNGELAAQLCCLLMRLCLTPANQETIGRVGVSVLLSIIKSRKHADNPEVLRWACGALHNACANNTANRDEAIRGGGLAAVQSVAAAHPGTKAADYATVAMSILRQHAIAADEPPPALASPTSPAAADTMSEDHSSDASIQDSARAVATPAKSLTTVSAANSSDATLVAVEQKPQPLRSVEKTAPSAAASVVTLPPAVPIVLPSSPSGVALKVTPPSAATLSPAAPAPDAIFAAAPAASAPAPVSSAPPIAPLSPQNASSKQPAVPSGSFTIVSVSQRSPARGGVAHMEPASAVGSVKHASRYDAADVVVVRSQPMVSSMCTLLPSPPPVC